MYIHVISLSDLRNHSRVATSTVNRTGGLNNFETDANRSKGPMLETDANRSKGPMFETDANGYLYIYIYIHIHMCIHICMYIYICICIYICI
jgi:hypothetical protein